MTLHKYRNIEHSIKGKYAEKKAKGEHQACFSLFYLSLIKHRVRLKMAPYSKTATTIWLYDVPRNVAEDLRIAFQQSNLFWQVSCAQSKLRPIEKYAHVLLNMGKDERIFVL